MIIWPGPLAIAAVFAIVIFYYMRKSARDRQDKQSERLQRHKECYDALMERRKKPQNNSAAEKDDPATPGQQG